MLLCYHYKKIKSTTAKFFGTNTHTFSILCYKALIMKERILKEIEEIQTYIEDCIEERNNLLHHVDNHDDGEYLFYEIRKYSNYKVALEQVVNDFPIEVGSY